MRKKFPKTNTSNRIDKVAKCNNTTVKKMITFRVPVIAERLIITNRRKGFYIVTIMSHLILRTFLNERKARRTTKRKKLLKMLTENVVS